MKKLSVFEAIHGEVSDEEDTFESKLDTSKCYNGTDEDEADSSDSTTGSVIDSLELKLQ